MGKLMVLTEPKKITFEEYSEATLAEKEIRIATLYSGISAGTQLTLYRGKNPFNEKLFDQEMRIFSREPSPQASLYPNRGCWGYEEVGNVVEVGSGVSSIKKGDIIYGAWGHRSTNIVTEEFALTHKLPKELDPILGIYAQMGAIAFNVILDADIHVGETVAIFGQGVPGQIISQLARLNGANVITIDLDDTRLSLSKKLGASLTLNPKQCDPALEIKKITGGGADKVIEISGVAGVLHEAIRAAAYNGRVVASGFIPVGASNLFLGEEFHHNRIHLISSQIGNVNPSVSNIWNRLRMEKTIFSLATQKSLDLSSLITHVIDFADAPKAYHLLDTETKNVMQVVLKF